MRYHEITEKKDELDLPSIEVGDEVMVGKFKNRKATVKGFTKDEHNQPVLKTNKGDQKLFKPRISKLEEDNVNYTPENDRIFLAYASKHNLKIADMNDAEIKKTYNDAINSNEKYVPTTNSNYLYHGIATSNISHIIKDGLLPSTKTNGKALITHSLGKVFFTDTIENAEWYGARANKKYSLLRVKRSNLEDALPDVEDETAMYVERSIPSDQIEIWKNYNWEPLN